jgi:hypothetical protein
LVNNNYFKQLPVDIGARITVTSRIKELVQVEYVLVATSSLISSDLATKKLTQMIKDPGISEVRKVNEISLIPRRAI